LELQNSGVKFTFYAGTHPPFGIWLGSALYGL